MLTKNNWYTSNIQERLTNPCADLKVEMNLYPFERMDFLSAAKASALEIHHNFNNLYLAYSGGYDSEFILRLLVGLNIPVTPVIVVLGNDSESKIAFDVCKELDVIPHVIELNEGIFLKTFYEKTWQILNGRGINSTQTLMVADYVNQQNGTLLTGNHLIGDDGIIEDEPNFYACEWDFYAEIFYPQLTNIDVLLYTPEVAFAPLFQIDGYSGKEWNEFRSDLYGVEYHTKFKPSYPPQISEILNKLMSNRPCRPNSHFSWTKTELLKLLND